MNGDAIKCCMGRLPGLRRSMPGDGRGLAADRWLVTRRPTWRRIAASDISEFLPEQASYGNATSGSAASASIATPPH